MRVPASSPIVAVVLAASLYGQSEPWYEHGDHEWGYSYWEGTFVGAGTTLPHKLMINYPALTSGLDATIVTQDGPYPVIFFQHAGGSWYDNYDYLFSRLASRGFLVVSAQHDDDSTWFCCGTYEEKHEDLFHAMIDVVFQWDADPTELLFGMVDEDRIALAGHSHGSMATLLAMEHYQPLDPSAQHGIDAIFMLAPCPNFTSSGEMETYPSLYAGMAPLQVVYGARDTDGCVANGQAIAIYEPGDRPRHYAYVTGADHHAFTDAGPLGQSTITREEAQRAAGTAAIAYFEWVLHGDQAALPYLAGDLALLDGAPDVAYQYHDPSHLAVDDFEDRHIPQTSVAIAGIPGQVFVNGFLSDAFVPGIDFNRGVELVREELRRIYPTATPPPYSVLFYEDLILGPQSVYEAALLLEQFVGKIQPFTKITNSSTFASQLSAGVGDVIVSAHQSSQGSHPHDLPLEARVCAGDPAILSDWRNLPAVGSATSELSLQCANTQFDATENWVQLTSASDLFTGTINMTNPGWGKSTVGLGTTATVFAVSEALPGGGSGDPTVNTLGFAVVPGGLLTFIQEDMLTPAKTLYHPTGGLEVAWDSPGAGFEQWLTAPGGSFDASAWGVVSFRLLQVQSDSTLNPSGGTKDLHIELRDIGGNAATLALSDAPQGPLRYPFAPSSSTGWKSVFETYRLPLGRFLQANPALDLTALEAIEFSFDLTPTGRLVFDDIEFAPLPAGLASATPRAACLVPAPPDSLVAVTDPPKPGTVFSVRVDDPFGVAGLTSGATVTAWALALGPDPNFPCGTPVPGLGELLIDVNPSSLLFVTPPAPWFAGAAPLHSVGIPADPSFLGLQVYTQGMLIDPIGGAGLVLTNALDLVIGS